MIRKNIVYILVGISAVLLVVNIAVESFSEPELVVIKNEISREQIEEIFISSLWNHGILEKWIAAKVINNPNFDSLEQVYYVDIPKDLQVVSVISSLSEDFNGAPVKLITEERVNHSNSTVKIYSNGVLKLEAFINQSDGIQREFSEITLIVQTGESLSEEQKISLRNFKIDYSFLFIPSVELIQDLEGYKQFTNSFALLINNDMDDDKYELDPDAGKNELSRNVVNLLSDFGRDVTYILDEKSEIYNSIAFPFVRDEFVERDITLHKLSDYTDLRGKPREQVKSIFKFHCENGRGKQRRFLIVSLDNFITLSDDIAKFRKLGDKFFSL